MTEIASETASDAVATDEIGDAGTEVWCPNLCGNRILDLGEKIGFPCPSCGTPMEVGKPEALTGKTKPVKIPAVGEIVHVLCSNTPEQVVRPAIVSARDLEGFLYVHVFGLPDDPMPPGLASREGTVRYGTHVGGWFYPAKDEKLTFDAPVE